MLRKIIGIAAPARSGKDTVASLLLQHNNISAYALADPLKLGCQALFGLTDEETWVDDFKEKSIALWERSPREFFQHVGTEWMRAKNPEHWLMRADRAINTPVENLEAPSLQDHKLLFKLAAQAFFGLSDKQTWDQNCSTVVDPFWNSSPQQMFDLIESLTIKDYPDYLTKRSQRPTTLSVSKQLLMNKNDIILIKDIRFENEADFLRRHNGVIWHIIRHDAQKVNHHSSEFGIKIKESDIVIDNNSSLEQLAVTVENEWLALQKNALFSASPNRSKESH